MVMVMNVYVNKSALWHENDDFLFVQNWRYYRRISKFFDISIFFFVKLKVNFKQICFKINSESLFFLNLKGGFLIPFELTFMYVIFCLIVHSLYREKRFSFSGKISTHNTTANKRGMKNGPIPAQEVKNNQCNI